MYNWMWLWLKDVISLSSELGSRCLHFSLKEWSDRPDPIHPGDHSLEVVLSFWVWQFFTGSFLSYFTFLVLYLVSFKLTNFSKSHRWPQRLSFLTQDLWDVYCVLWGPQKITLVAHGHNFVGSYNKLPTHGSFKKDIKSRGRSQCGWHPDFARGILVKMTAESYPGLCLQTLWLDIYVLFEA